MSEATFEGAMRGAQLAMTTEGQLSIADEIHEATNSPLWPLAERVADLLAEMRAKAGDDPFAGMRPQLDATLADWDAAGGTRDQLTRYLGIISWMRRGKSRLVEFAESAGVRVLRPDGQIRGHRADEVIIDDPLARS